MRQFIKKNIWAVAPVVFVLVALVLLGSPFGSGLSHRQSSAAFRLCEQRHPLA